MNDIFISYRRDDSAGHAGRLFDGLKDRLGAEHVFMDVTDLRPGQDFAVELERAVAKADCVLAGLEVAFEAFRQLVRECFVDDRGFCVPTVGVPSREPCVRAEVLLAATAPARRSH